MLNPRAYRAALLEQLTSAGDAPAEAADAAVPPARHPSTAPQSTCVLEDDVKLQGRGTGNGPRRRSADSFTAPYAPAQPPESASVLYTVGPSYAVEQESNHSLILSFIDNCIRAGVPEASIAEQVQFMVASMKESLALHAALHAQRHKNRIREYELGALTNMVERQQIQLQQHQQQQQQHYFPVEPRMGYEAAPLQLAPPPPLVYAGPTSPLRAPTAAEHIHTRAPPQRQPPSPPHGAASFMPSAVPFSTWHHASLAPFDSQPSAHLPGKHQQTGGVHSSGGDTPSSRSGSNSSSSGKKSKRTGARRSQAKPMEGRSAPVAEVKDGAPHHYDDQHRDHSHHHSHHHHHRSHHTLCDVCLRNAAAEAEGEEAQAAAAASAAKRTTRPPTSKAKRAGRSAVNTPQQHHRLSPTAPRQRYVPHGHYMKPTHASLVRRASSTSPLRTATTPSRRPSPMHRHAAAPLPSPSPHPHQHPQQQQQQRRLVVRSTYSSRLRASASRPPLSLTDRSGSTRDADGAESSGDREDGSSRGGYSRSSSSSSSSSSSAVSSINASVVEERRKRAKQQRHATRKETRRRDESHTVRAASLDLYTNDTPREVSAGARVARAAQTDSWVAQRPTTRLSIDPEPTTAILSAEAGQRTDDSAGDDAGRTLTVAWGARTAARGTTVPVAQSPIHTDEAEGKKQRPPPQQQQREAQRPSRDAPRPTVPSTTPPTTASHPPASNIATIVVMDRDDDDAAVPPVCVTSPQLQYFLEASQRKVRETERLLARRPQPTAAAPSVTWGPQAPQLHSSENEARPTTAYHVRSPPHEAYASKLTSSVSSSPYVASSAMWSDKSAGGVSAARATQLQRLRDLRDRLRDYDTLTQDSSIVGGSGGGALRRADETTFASGWTPATTGRSPDPRFQPYARSAAVPSLDKSPLIEISPTSSDEDSSGY